MRIGQFTDRRLISQALLVGLLFPWTSALAGDDFGANWQPKPLVDNNAPAPAQTSPKVPSAQAAPPPIQPDLEARLKPVEPFVKEIENRLTISPKPGTGLVQRLNTIQTVLFGAQQYQDAGQLITKLSEVFPDEAKKAQAEMDRQAQVAMQAAQSAQAAQAASLANNKPAKGNALVNAPVASMRTASAAGQVQPAPKKRHSFWDTDDFDSDFDNDPFFKDAFQGRAKVNATQASAATQRMNMSTAQQQALSSGAQNYSQQSAGPSKLASIAQGLAGLALVAGGIAGAAFLNGKMNHGPSGYAYPNGYSGYGYPYNYPVYGNAYGMQPYGYGVSPYGTGIMPYGTGMTNYGSGFNSYGTSSIGSGMVVTPGGYGAGTPFWQPYRGY